LEAMTHQAARLSHEGTAEAFDQVTPMSYRDNISNREERAITPLFPGHAEAFHARSSSDRDLLAGVSCESPVLSGSTRAARHRSQAGEQPAGNPFCAIPPHVIPASGGEYGAVANPGGYPVRSQQRRIRCSDGGRYHPWRWIDLAAGPERCA